MSERNGQVTRILSVLNMLLGAPQGLTVKEIWSRLKERNFKIEIRSIYRDIEALQGVFPIYTEDTDEENNSQRWKIDKTARVGEHFILTYSELLALYFARGVLTPLRDTPFYADLSRVFDRIEGVIGTKSKDYFDELNQEIQFEPSPRWGLGIDPDILETVRASCAEKHILKGEYYSANSGEKKIRNLGPHYLYFARGSMYLVAEDLNERKTKVFSLARFSTAEMTAEEYTGSTVDPETFFMSSFGIYHGTLPVEVKIEFSQKLAPFVKERRWHASQRNVNIEGGKLILHLEVGITPELVQWILGFGSEAKIISPNKLQNQVIEQAEKIIQLYKTNIKVA